MFLLAYIFFQLKKDYAFSYKVRDQATGDDFSHTQSQTRQATKGEYRVKLPDGRVQIVSYTADENGYKADVKYEEDDSPTSSHDPLTNQVEKPVFSNPNPINYYKSLQRDFPRSQHKLQPHNYYDSILHSNVPDGYIAVTPAPFYTVTPKQTYFSNNVNDYNHQVPQNQHIQIFSNGLFGKSTLAPSTEYYPHVLSENVDSGAYQNIYTFPR